MNWLNVPLTGWDTEELRVPRYLERAITSGVQNSYRINVMFMFQLNI